MDWPDELSEGFPPAHRDEPEWLRGDIVDELADHLDCSYRRERHRTTDDNQARLAVLKRFGNPAAVVGRLWWENMKE